MMSESKRLQLVDLNDEQFACLRDYNRRAAAHGMLDDLRDRCGYDVDALRATLPPLGRFRAVIKKYPDAKETTTGGNCTAIQIACADGTYLLLTDPRDAMSPEDDAETVCVSRHNDQGPVAITPDLRGDEDGTVEVPVEDLSPVIDAAMGRTRKAGREPAALERRSHRSRAADLER